MSKKIIVISSTLIGAPLTFGIVSSIVYTQLANENQLDTNQINLSNENITFSATVTKMNSITSVEANKIKNNLTNLIVTKMSGALAQLNIDYTIEGLNDIQQGMNLKTIQVNVISISGSKKVSGETNIQFSWKEDINTWSLNSPIEIPSNQQNGLLDDAYVSLLKNHIMYSVNSLLNEGQSNQLDVNYQILNLDLLIVGAAFSDYQNKIIVQAIPNNGKLIGKFQVLFVIVDS